MLFDVAFVVGCILTPVAQSKSAIGKGKAKFVDEMHLDLWMRGPLEQRLEAHKRCTDQDTANLIVSMRLLADWDTLTDHGTLDKKQDDPALTARAPKLFNPLIAWHQSSSHVSVYLRRRPVG